MCLRKLALCLEKDTVLFHISNKSDDRIHGLECALGTDSSISQADSTHKEGPQFLDWGLNQDTETSWISQKRLPVTPLWYSNCKIGCANNLCRAHCDQRCGHDEGHSCCLWWCHILSSSPTFFLGTLVNSLESLICLPTHVYFATWLVLLEIQIRKCVCGHREA